MRDFVLPTIDATGTLGHDLTTHALAERLDAGHRRQTVDQESRSLADEAKAAILSGNVARLIQ